jgi:prevent-host-death family protein
MKKVSAAEFRTHCYQWMEHARSTREHVMITKHGKPIAKLVPLRKEEAAENTDSNAGEGARANKSLVVVLQPQMRN